MAWSSLLIGLMTIILFIGLSIRSIKRAGRLKYIKNYTFHPAIKEKLKNKHPGLTDKQLELVFSGLRDYFHIFNQANGLMLSMPSRVIDDAWHEFILFSRAYDLFCRKAFGRFLHHTPAVVIKKPNQLRGGIKNTWRLACRKAQIDPKKPMFLPLLFAIDAELAIPDGFRYSLNCIPGDGQYCVSDFGCSSGVDGDGDDGSGCGSDCGGGCGGD